MVHFAIFEPLRLATPISEIFQIRWKLLLCYAQSDFGHEKFIEQCFHTLSAIDPLKTKILQHIDLTLETLRSVGNP